LKILRMHRSDGRRLDRIEHRDAARLLADRAEQAGRLYAAARLAARA
jgi:hypothetical protein